MQKNEILEKVKQSIKQSFPLTVTTYTLPHSKTLQIDEILTIYLQELGQNGAVSLLSYCVKELAANARKANTKRVYFEEKNLDIHNKQDYEIGMKDFKEEISKNYRYWLDLQKKRRLYVKFLFHSRRKNFRVVVENNVPITQEESARIQDRISRSKTFDSLDDAFNQVLDYTEGAGLGISIMLLMLRKTGLDESAYSVQSGQKITRCSITIPTDDAALKKADMLIHQIVEKIDQLPQFPENISAIQSLINDPKSDLKDIAQEINTDISLTANLLKMVNSTLYMLPNKIDNIVDAVKMLGLHGVRNMLFSYGTEQNLTMSSHSHLWDHSRRVAFYSSSFARKISRNKDLIDETYVGGLLHDIGKVVMSSVNAKLMKELVKFSQNKGFELSLLEKLFAGFDHAEVGAKIAEKWNFTESLIQLIRYHHEPHLCNPDYRSMAYCVYLGNALCGYVAETVSYDMIDQSILQKFHISSEDQLKKITNLLLENYEKQFD